MGSLPILSERPDPAERIVHVIDDDEGMRVSLQFLLETSDCAVKTYASAAEFLAQPALAAGCIVTDVRMPDMNGLELMQRLNARASRLPVLVITGHGDIQMAVEAMKAGAVEFLEKPFDDKRLLHAVRGALERSTDQAKDPKSVADPEAARLAGLLQGLSPREVDVLRGLVAGGSNKSIALDLGISPRTVEIYRANLMLKTGAASLAELVRFSLVAGFR